MDSRVKKIHKMTFSRLESHCRVSRPNSLIDFFLNVYRLTVPTTVEKDWLAIPKGTEGFTKLEANATLSFTVTDTLSRGNLQNFRDYLNSSRTGIPHGHGDILVETSFEKNAATGVVRWSAMHL